MNDDGSGDYIPFKKKDSSYEEGLKIILSVHGITSKIDTEIFKQMLYLCNDDGIVSLSSIVKDSICEELSINKTNFSKNIKRLIDANVIQGNKGTYIINNSVMNILNQLELGNSNTITIRLC